MSDRLKPCPFCGGEAYVNDEYAKGFGFIAGCRNCCIWTPWDNRQEEAIEHWNRRPAPHKYTLEELRKLDGQPVWCKTLGETANSGWSIVGVTNGDVWLSHYVFTTHQTYGETWVAYDRPPEED